MTITEEQEPQRALAWAQRIINSDYTDQNLRELVVYLMQTLEQTGAEVRRLRRIEEAARVLLKTAWYTVGGSALHGSIEAAKENLRAALEPRSSEDANG